MTDDLQKELVQRVQLIEDKFSILEHTAAYNEAWDDGRLDDWVATWTDEGTFVLPGAPDTIGPESLRAMVAAMQAVGFVHLTMNPRVRISGDSARQDCYVVLGTRSPGKRPDTSKWVTSGRYTDDLVRTPDGWRFARRVFAPDASMSGLPKWW